MYNTNVTNACANLEELVDMVLNDSEVINISTDRGNAIMISEDNYNALLKTICQRN